MEKANRRSFSLSHSSSSSSLPPSPSEDSFPSLRSFAAAVSGLVWKRAVAVRADAVSVHSKRCIAKRCLSN